MKTLIIIFTFFQSITFGQSLFFDSVDNSKWISELDIIDLSAKSANNIGLNKITFSLDELTRNVIIWSFNEGVLTITEYDYQLKTENVLKTYIYLVDKDKSILRVLINPKNTIAYKVGMTSMASYVILSKSNRKRFSIGFSL